MTRKNENEYLSAAEAARTLKLSKQRVCGLCAEGKLSGAQKLGGIMWSIPKKSVRDYKPPLKGFAIDKERRDAAREAQLKEINAARQFYAAQKQAETAAQKTEADRA